MLRPDCRLPAFIILAVWSCLVVGPAASGRADEPVLLPAADGFRGIWYANQPSDDEYRFKYSGGLGTYPQQHVPIAVYAPQANKTFFCWGGRPADRNRLLHMLSYYDHPTGLVARPRILLDKETSDAHDNPTLQIDAAGHLWVFSNAHGPSRPSYIHRSREPYSIESFERVRTTNFSYGQPWFIADQGFVFLHTLYDRGRRFLYASRSPDGLKWEEPELLARVAEGHYQVSWPNGKTIGTAFNYHPAGKGLNWRTNLYYMETRDGGRTWLNARGDALALPLTEPGNPALAVEYESQGRLVYLKDLQFTSEGHPVILYLTSRGYASGPENDPRVLTTARWTGSEWQLREVCRSDNNYDFASLYVEPNGTWRLIGTTEPGPQRYNTGGEVALWVSCDQGFRWEKLRQLTHDSEYNHTYPRRPYAAHADFYAIWADGHARQPSPSRLYFANRDGTQVWRLPEHIEPGDDLVRPEPLRR